MSDEETKPSPGPWRACHEGDCKCGLVWSIPEDRCVAMVIREDETGSVTEETRAANMRLIASAPDLQAALATTTQQLREAVELLRRWADRAPQAFGAAVHGRLQDNTDAFLAKVTTS